MLTVTDRDGATVEVEAEDGLTVMEAIRASGKGDIVALCGGTKSCATCHVYVAEEWQDKLAPADEDEQDLLDTSGFRQANSRLSCQIPVSPDLDGFAVTIAPEE